MNSYILKLSLAAAVSLTSLVAMTPSVKACGGGYGQALQLPQVPAEHVAVQQHFAARELGRITQIATLSTSSSRALVRVAYVTNGATRTRVFVLRVRNAAWRVTGSARAA